MCVLSLSFAAGLSGQPDRCLHWLQAAEPLIEPDSEPFPGWRSLRAAADSMWSAYGAGGDPDAALRYARRAAELEDDPALWGYVVARQALADALLGAGSAAEAAAVLRDCWLTPSRKRVADGAVAAVRRAVRAGADRDRRCARPPRRCAPRSPSRRPPPRQRGVTPPRRRSRRSGSRRRRIAAAKDPAAALPELRRAARLAQSWGPATLVVSALTSLAAAEWAVGHRDDGPRPSLDRAREVADTEPTWAFARSQLDDLQTRIGRGSAGVARARGELTEELTDRELAILRALRGPLSTREIGRELYLSINTVKGYSKNLYRKLGVVTRADAVRRGQELGLI